METRNASNQTRLPLCKGGLDVDQGGGRGRRPGRRGERVFFVHGFAKNDRGNLEQDEIKAYRKLAEEMLELNDVELEVALSKGSIVEVNADG